MRARGLKDDRLMKKVLREYFLKFYSKKKFKA